MRNSLFLLFGALLLVLFPSCSKKSLPITTYSGGSLETANLDIQGLEFTYLSARSRVKYEDQATNFTATANIRMLKDSVIWFSLASSIGIEAIRGIITQDTIIVIDRLKKTYVGYNFDSLGVAFNFPLDYDLVQAMLLGKMSRPMTPKDVVIKEKGFLVLEQANHSFSIRNFITKKDFALKRVEFTQNPTLNRLSLEFANFRPTNEIVFPYASRVKVNYADQGNILNTVIEINYNKVLFDEKPLRFPFSVPSKYERK